MNSIAGSLSQYVAVAPSAAEAPSSPPRVAARRRPVSLAERAEQLIFPVGLLGAAVMAGSFLWQILQ